VHFYHELAHARPDAFTLDLALSLAMRADCLEAMGQREVALADSREAIAALRPKFLQVP
jgi:hypothetical protein